MYFILFIGKDGQWYWNLNSNNHKIIATGGEGYRNKRDAIHTINIVRQHAGSGRVYDKSTESWF